MGVFNDYTVYNARAAAAAAGTVNVYLPLPSVFMAQGYAWFYETAEANVDNTLDFLIRYTTDGSAFTNIKANGNPNGLLETSGLLVVNDRRGDAASSGAAALATAVFTPVRVPGDAVLHLQIVTAGTGTIPAINLCVYGYHVGAL